MPIEGFEHEQPARNAQSGVFYPYRRDQIDVRERICGTEDPLRGTQKKTQLVNVVLVILQVYERGSAYTRFGYHSKK